MHELSIAQSIFEIVEGAVPAVQAAGVKTVRVRIGRLSGVVADSLEFCFSAIVAETAFCNAALSIESVPIVAQCESCANRFTTDEPAFLCPSCGGADITLVSGTEMQVAEIELLDDPVETT